ncbi:hypothetical protein RRG08_011066 [Elysia crispata]|uniref:Uncharacterized protein n=1 Tax=Elysia crispata TaxID=231223 RepID=A0AAE0Z8Y5_9GAST|nr:hypothetical protein RRG08_011066 [Elysia crispata]
MGSCPFDLLQRRSLRVSNIIWHQFHGLYRYLDPDSGSNPRQTWDCDDVQKLCAVLYGAPSKGHFRLMCRSLKTRGRLKMKVYCLVHQTLQTSPWHLKEGSYHGCRNQFFDQTRSGNSSC